MCTARTPVITFRAALWVLCLALVCGSFFGLPRLAIAGPQAPDDGCLTDSVCRNHYNQAVGLFENGRFESALPEFQAAYQRRQMPWLLINIGRTLHRLGRPREALDYYERYKAAETKSDPETQERLEKYIAQAKALADTGATASPVSSSAPGAPTDASKSADKDATPVYKKWWFWTAIGGGAALVIIVGAAAGAAAQGPRYIPDTVMTYQPTF